MAEQLSGGIQNARRITVLPTSRVDSAAQISLAPLEPSARFALRMRAATAEELGESASFRFDIPINTCVVTNDRTIARLGPDEWLLLASDAEGERLSREITAALAGKFFSLVDISHRNAAIAVAGAHARETLNGGCPLDLGDEAFPPGSATRTLMGKAEIILLRPGAEAVYRVECWRSFAPYVSAFLNEVAREFTGK